MTNVWQAGVLRALAWTARGARSPARRLAAGRTAPSAAYGRAYGVERAGDNLGAVAGPLLAALLVGVIGIRPTMWCAAIPGVFAAIAILVAAREARRLPQSARPSLRFAVANLPSARSGAPFRPDRHVRVRQHRDDVAHPPGNAAAALSGAVTDCRDFAGHPHFTPRTTPLPPASPSPADTGSTDRVRGWCLPWGPHSTSSLTRASQ